MHTIIRTLRRLFRWGLTTGFGLIAVLGWLPAAQAQMQPESTAQQRIDAVRQRLLELDQSQPDTAAEAQNEYLAQWYNWPNWPNWGNWGNWPNYWMNY